MERLDVAVAPERANIEAAIHFARYAIAKGLVKGKRVLDIACGEGYGSYLLKQAGAESVVGVDISAESVMRARRSFATEGLEYVASDAKNLETLFAENSFDLVISVETIEHVEDPVDFLKNLKRLTQPDGVLIVSCPNDHWYYPDADQSNPYHRRKYRIDEFQNLCVPVLGTNVQWSIGTGVFGFASTPLNPETSYEKLPNTWMSFQDIPGAYLVHGENDLSVSATQSSYFVGVWNAPGHVNGGAVFPLAMELYEGVVQAQYGFNWFESVKADLQHAVEAARAECFAVRQALLGAGADSGISRDADVSTLSLVQELEGVLKATRNERRRLGLMLHATQVENDVVQRALQAKYETERREIQEECNRYRVGYERYVRLSKLFPPAFRSWLVKVVKSMRGQGA